MAAGCAASVKTTTLAGEVNATGVTRPKLNQTSMASPNTCSATKPNTTSTTRTLQIQTVKRSLVAIISSNKFCCFSLSKIFKTLRTSRPISRRWLVAMRNFSNKLTSRARAAMATNTCLSNQFCLCKKLRTVHWIKLVRNRHKCQPLRANPLLASSKLTTTQLVKALPPMCPIPRTLFSFHHKAKKRTIWMETCTQVSTARVKATTGPAGKMKSALETGFAWSAPTWTSRLEWLATDASAIAMLERACSKRKKNWGISRMQVVRRSTSVLNKLEILFSKTGSRASAGWLRVWIARRPASNRVLQSWATRQMQTLISAITWELWWVICWGKIWATMRLCKGLLSRFRL